MGTKRKKRSPVRASGLASQRKNSILEATAIESEAKTSLAQQIIALRGNMSQAAFGKLIGKPQSVVSRLEDPNYGKVTLQTLLDIALKPDVAVLVRFVSHDAYQQLKAASSQETLRPQHQSSKKSKH